MKRSQRAVWTRLETPKLETPTAWETLIKEEVLAKNIAEVVAKLDKVSLYNKMLAKRT